MKKIYILFGASFLLALSSCNKNFEKINTNPNGLNKVNPANLLAPALKKSVEYNMSRSQRLTNELMQVTVNMGDGDGKIFRYEIRANEADYLYNNLFTQLYNFRDIYNLAEKTESKSYMGVSLICQAWLYSILTDTYGDIPFSTSLLGRESNITPEFDSQEDIYKGLFLALDSANVYLKGAANIEGGSDPIYNGNTALWRKFGNSLYLRLLMRVSHKPSLDAPNQIKKMVETSPADYPLIANNSESAILRWTGSSPYVSPFATWRPGDWYTPKLASFFVDNLNEWSDPRIQKWATLYNGNYEGIPSGYPIGTNPIAKSTLLTSLMSEPLLGNILNYAEVQFILAEAAAKNWTANKLAKEYYETGIKNAIEMWGVTMPDYYLTGVHINWDNATSLDQQMALIHQQKYYSLFFTDLQSWFEFRRTGHPELPILSGHLNGGIMPARLNYPVYLQAANPENYKKAVSQQGPDNINTLVWWQKP
ncbi:SusD/RagB family nutrient-binding outer membrane lipoprotein [Sphingobacterium tabacisoli]|uniref:SusD/RagB family nutrient-binding outer membrane lipoprotein n=1 Tax=Sphingobacterium tabacisoli TaxID=2044855 RepID=A0ABW5L3E9_9SPHI|nr:SusD/RagB family nutrient-binding outer membrane lipoprotein [Sphingobacterium tabacisoli]